LKALLNQIIQIINHQINNDELMLFVQKIFQLIPHIKSEIIQMNIWNSAFSFRIAKIQVNIGINIINQTKFCNSAIIIY